MKFLLVANTMEHPGFAAFLEGAARRYPDAAFAMAGDLLNVFPEPGEDIRSSIFYELYGDMAVDALQQLHKHHFVGAADSPLIGPLRETFGERGRKFLEGRALASRRYGRVFGEIRATLGKQALYFVPGNMDYPELADLFAAACPHVHSVDGRLVDMDGILLGGMGGIPSSAQPLGRITPISPYEMSEAAYAERLEALRGCDVLLTHLAPEECPALEAFVRANPVRLMLCRAPFDFRRNDNCRGLSQVSRLGETVVLKIRPFEYPENATFVVELGPTGDPHVEIFTWRAGEASPGARPQLKASGSRLQTSGTP